MKDLPNDWIDLDDEEIIDKLKNDEVDLNILEILSDTDNFEIKAAIILNPNISDSLLQDLSEDESGNVEQALIARDLPSEWRYLEEDQMVNKLKIEQNLDVNILEILSSIPYAYELKDTLVLLDETPKYILDKLQEEGDVNQEIWDARGLPSEWRFLDKESKKLKIKTEKIVNEDVLKILSSDLDLREEVALLENLPLSIINKLDRDLLEEAKNNDSCLLMNMGYKVKSAFFAKGLGGKWETLRFEEKEKKIENIDFNNCSDLEKEFITNPMHLHPMRRTFIFNSSIPEKIITKLKKHYKNDDDIQLGIELRNFPEDWRRFWFSYLDDPYCQIFEEFIERFSHEPIEKNILKAFATLSNDTEVKLAISKNINTPEEILFLLRDITKNGDGGYAEYEISNQAKETLENLRLDKKQIENKTTNKNNKQFKYSKYKLTGKELLNKLEEISDIEEYEKIKICGYFELEEDGSEQLFYSPFYLAKLQALESKN